MITVIGMGPGSEEYISASARRAIGEADIIFGSERWLSMLANIPAEKAGISPVADLLQRLRELGGAERAAVLVSGDPGLFSLLNVIEREVPEGRLSVIPGISAPQVLFARLGRDWSGVVFISLHGRAIDGLTSALRPGARLCLFNDGVNTPMAIGRAVLEQGYRGRAVVGSDLTYENEVVAEMAIEDLAAYQSAILSIVYLEIDR